MAYFGWNVNRLKQELIKRGAKTSGRKEDLVSRLESYDRNQNFQAEAVLLPEPLDPDWPDAGFHQLQEEHRIVLPKLTKAQIDGYFKYRESTDKHICADLKSLKKGHLLYKGKRIHACSINVNGPVIFFTGIVGAAMKKQLTYSFKLKLRKENGEVINTHCECPAGKGPHGTCKHLAAILIMLSEFVSGCDNNVEKTCTEILQTFHKPKKSYFGSPVKAKDLYKKDNDTDLDDPRPPSFRNLAGYSEHVKNTVINYCSTSSKDLAIRYIWDKADIQSASKDHDYLAKPVLEQWVGNSLHTTSENAIDTEKATRKQANCRLWHEKRLWRITASRFGEVCKLTARRNMDKLCRSFTVTSSLCTKPLIHGRQYEAIAIQKFEGQTGLKVKPCGLYIDEQLSYLACTPDGLIKTAENSIIEVKCPYNGRESYIKPGKLFPFLQYNSSNEICIKQTSNYYYQIQGQMHICRKRFCYFVTYTFKDILILKIEKDTEYCEGSLIPKLTTFYQTFLRKYVANKM